MASMAIPRDSEGLRLRAGTFQPQPPGFLAFIPARLPPDPPLDMADDLVELLSRADVALGRLDGAAAILPNPDFFVGMYVRQEAVLSSQIEGTQASLADVLEFEIDEQGRESPKDVAEVVNYVRAMNVGLKALPKTSLSMKLVKDIHRELMRGVRGQDKSPGEFRQIQNWIGPSGGFLWNATFVPPPPHQMATAIQELESFMEQRRYPPLIRAGLVHAQFETIHPFLDGNGRMGRLLITLMLCDQGILTRPLLYLSHYLKRHRGEYYERLQAIRLRGQWEEWLTFFLRGVGEVATEACGTARAILSLRENHRKLLSGQGKASGNLLRALDVIFEQPVVSGPFLARALGLTPVGTNHLVERLIRLEILWEQTGFRRNRRYAYVPYLRLFSEPAMDADDPTIHHPEQTRAGLQLDAPGIRP